VSTFVAAFHGRSERATEGTPNPPVQRASNDKVNHVEWETLLLLAGCISGLGVPYAAGSNFPWKAAT